YRTSAFESEANRTARQDAYTHSSLGVRRTHKGIATTADHIWIARNRGKFILTSASIRRSRCYLGGPAMMPDNKKREEQCSGSCSVQPQWLQVLSLLCRHRPRTSITRASITP